MEFSPSEVASYVSARLPGLKRAGREWRGGCPVHGGKDPNFVIHESGVAQCHSQCAEAWDLLGLEMVLGNLDFPKAKAEVYRIVGRPNVPEGERDFVAIYDYTDAAGRLQFQVVRKTPGSDGKKRFAQRRPDGAGGWVWSIKGLERVPYRLAQLAAASEAWIVEGEKDVHTLERWGLVATCNPGGAGNWQPELTQYFAGKSVWIIPDNDEPGRDHALKVAAALAPIAAAVKIIELPGLPEKGDVSDWAKRNGTAKHLRLLADAAKAWGPDWKFNAPSEEDQFIETLEHETELAGGLDAFWDLRVKNGILTPWQRLTDGLNGGMVPGEIYILGGNQKSGKSSLALQFVVAALRDGKGVLMFSMEMAWRQIFHRMVAMEARVDLLHLRRSQQDNENVDEELAKLRAVQGELERYALMVHQKTAITPGYLASEVKRLRLRRSVDLVLVDHMQLMAAHEKSRSEYEKFTAISRALKSAALEAGVPVLVVSQCSRRNAMDKRTELESQDLRASGALEEDAAAVMLLYPDIKDQKEAAKEAGNRLTVGPVKAWLKLDLNRYGWAGMKLAFMHQKRYTRFDLCEKDD
jgi:archaellum biogenesis ATPase FlaH